MMVTAPSSPDHAERARALALLKRFGWNVTSFQSLESGFRYWFADDAYVAFVDTGHAWVAAGAPIAAPERMGEIARQFVESAAANRRRVCFFGVEQRFVQAVALHATPIGEQPVWNPAEWESTIRSSRSLREQLRRARAKAVKVRLLEPAELVDPTGPQRRAIDALIQRWLASRRMAPMGFLVQIDPFLFPAERRFFVAHRNDQLIGFLALVPVYARNGWFLEDLLRDAAAPNGTAESLVDAAMRRIAGEGSDYATLGLAALSGGTTGWLRRIRAWSVDLYNFEGLRAFRERLRPRLWTAIYLAHPPRQSELLTLYDVLAAFSRGGLLRFGFETLLRVPEIGFRVLAGLLIPWIILLACAPASRWFPTIWIQRAWAGFDILILVALLVLSVRWRQWLAVFLASIISMDALITAFEVLTFNLPRARHLLDWTVSFAALLAPLAAALFLWGTVLHRARSAAHT